MKTFLAAEHHEVVDVGTYGQDPVDDPDYARAVGAAALEHCTLPCWPLSATARDVVTGGPQKG